jgi:hypothetical protein
MFTSPRRLPAAILPPSAPRGSVRRRRGSGPAAVYPPPTTPVTRRDNKRTVHLLQIVQRKSRPLTMPVLAIGGAESWGEAAGHGMEPAADDVQTVVIPAALTAFLAPYRDG